MLQLPIGCHDVESLRLTSLSHTLGYMPLLKKAIDLPRVKLAVCWKLLWAAKLQEIVETFAQPTLAPNSWALAKCVLVNVGQRQYPTFFC